LELIWFLHDEQEVLKLFKRFLSFFEKIKQLFQSSTIFEKNICTIHGLLDVITTAYDNIQNKQYTYDNIQNKQYTGILFLDLKKAFDTVCHKILLRKLEHYGIKGTPLSLINSLLERKQFVSIKGTNSKLQQNKFSVPQEVL